MDNKLWSFELEKGKQIKPGSLLLSEPFMVDENFSRTVIMLCEHTKENGTVGLILNKPVKLRLSDVIPDFPDFPGKLYLGGPVGTDTLQFLHRLGSKIEGGVALGDGLYWGGNFEQIKLLIENNSITPGDISFYIGYSGWSDEQLEEELKGNSWIIADAKTDIVFSYNPSAWRDILKDMGGVYEVMSGYPENPILN